MLRSGNVHPPLEPARFVLVQFLSGAGREHACAGSDLHVSLGRDCGLMLWPRKATISCNQVDARGLPVPHLVPVRKRITNHPQGLQKSWKPTSWLVLPQSRDRSSEVRWHWAVESMAASRTQ